MKKILVDVKQLLSLEQTWFTRDLTLGFLYLMLFLFRRSAGFLTTWQGLEETLGLFSPNQTGAASYLLFIDLLRGGAYILLFAFFLGILFFEGYRVLFRQQQRLEFFEVSQKFPYLSLFFIFIRSLLLGGLAIFLAQLLTQRFLTNLGNLTNLKDAVLAYPLNNFPDWLLLAAVGLAELTGEVKMQFFPSKKTQTLIIK
ncbi:hypothetical protein [Enterococcus massiliensis]|uniref:hypothetical protein n=1 Tax=Enterococcus massiliensis TaxID=1640685 RepID=UPI00065E8EB4|nr:hypothetical protein [Enterococcus massiliensis]